MTNGEASADNGSSEKISRRRVLILEDDNNFVEDVESISRSIEDANLDWDHASSIEEGLTLLSPDGMSPPDIAIVDVGLDGENGLDFVREARHRNYLFPIIVISSNELDEIQYRGEVVSMYQLIALGATEFQSKTHIGDSQENFLRLILSVVDQFERLLLSADKPDRLFHSSLSHEAIADLTQAISLCKRGRFHIRKFRHFSIPEENNSEMAIFHLERVIEKEKLRLQYTLNLSVRDKLRAFSNSSPASTEDENVAGKSGAPMRLFEAFARFWNLRRPLPLNRLPFE